MGIDYTAVDGCILSSIRSGRPTFPMMVDDRNLAHWCKQIQFKDWENVIDRRLQSLKRKGVIRYTNGMWLIL